MTGSNNTEVSRGDILIVDDNLENIRTLMALLTEEGYSVRAAPNGRTALMIVNSLRPELILLDVKMCGMDGYEVCRKLKADERTSDIAVMFISALDALGDRVKGFEIGAVDYITKPLHREEVLARVHTHIAIKRMQRDLREQNARLQEEVRRHEKTGDALRKARDELEVRVEQRTAKLAKANEELTQEISERKQAEKALQESEEKFRNLFETSVDGIIVVDAETELIIDVNGACEEIYGYSKEEFLQKKFMEISDDPEKTREALQPTLDGSLRKIPLRHHRRKDGSVFPVETSVGKFSLNGKEVAYGVLRDITDRIEVEAERRSLERQVQHAQKLESLGVLAGGIAHDFNNLLMAILGNADLAMDDTAIHAPARENIKEIIKASKRAAELAKQMLAYSGKGRFVIEPIDLNRFVAEMCHLLEVSISKKVVLKYNFADNLPTFDGDATQIRQIVMNLITNASEAIGDKSGEIALSTGAMHCDRAYLDDVNEVLKAGLDKPLDEGQYVCLEVADTGCGMNAETIEKIFDPFFTTKFTGRGLGMAAVLGIVRGHRGAIRIHSEVGKGASFKILFPANEALENDDDATQTRDADQDDSWRGRGTVLIADDEETVCAVGKQMLCKMGFNVLSAVDGYDAIEVFRDHADEIVCVLLDLTMPRMDGEQAFQEIRRIRSDVTVILCSGYDEQDATQRFAGKGLAGFIQKPYNMTELRAKLMAVLPGDKL